MVGRCTFGWLLDGDCLALSIPNSMKVPSDLKVNHLHMSVDGMNQLPHAEGLLFISSAGLALDRGGGSWVRDLLGNGESSATPIICSAASHPSPNP